MNRKIIVITVILIVIIALISMKITQTGHSTTQVHTTSPNTSTPVEHDTSTTLSTTGRDAIFIDRKDPKKRLDVPSDAILKMKGKIYALGGYNEGVAVILSEDLRPICHVKLNHITWKAEKYDEDKFISMTNWYWYSELAAAGSNITMFDYKFNQIWSVNGNFSNFKVANNKIYAIEHRVNSSYLDIFDGNGNLIKSFKIIDNKEIPEDRRNQLIIGVKDGKIYTSYTLEDTKPRKLILLRFDEEGNLELKRVVYETENFESIDNILSHRDGLLLAVSSAGSSCRFIYTDKDGNILGEARWKPPFGEGCAANAKILNGKAYIFGWGPATFTGYVGLINESMYAIYLNESIYHAEAQEIFVQRNGTPQDNSLVRDVLLDDELYVIGLVQMDAPSGAFIVRVDPYLDVDIGSLLERADVIYLEDIPPCKP